MDGEFRVGDYTVKPRTLMISKENLDVRLEPKMMDLLIYLAHNPGEVVQKAEIIAGVWADYFVTEDVLSNTVWKLRHAFQDNHKKPRYIETIYKKGYRLVAPVRFPEHFRNDDVLPLTVGRQSEMAELQKFYDRVVGGHGLLVCVSGEAGIGKTTLLEQFLRLRATSECFIGRGKCSEQLAGSAAYLPIIEALEEITLSNPDSDPGRLLKQTAPCWYLQVFPHPEGDPLIAAQAAGSSPERMKREIVEFFSSLSARHPVILFFDDVHWADASGLDVGAYLCDHFSSKRILILTAYRPEFLLAGNHPFIDLMLRLKAHGVCRELPVALLEREDISSFIDQSFPGHRFPSGLVDFIHGRTEGNPLFMVDLLAHFRDQELIAFDEGDACWKLQQSLKQMKDTIPDSIKSLIGLKIRQIGEQNNHLLGCAAIQGPEFDSIILARSLGLDQSQVEEDLQHLESMHGLIRRLETRSVLHALFEHYRFNHILYQEAFTEMLNPARRALLSGRVAESLCDIKGDASENRDFQIAFLFEAAGSDLKAAKYFLLAAQRSLQIPAYPESLTLARRGLRAVEGISDSSERLRLEIPLHRIFALSLTQLNGFAHPDAKNSYNRMYEICTKSGDTIEASRYLLAIASYWLGCANLKKTIEVCRRYHTLPKSHRNEILEMWFYLISSIALTHSGDLANALAYARKCVAIGRAQQHSEMVSFGDFDAGIIGHIHLARVLCLCGYPEQGRTEADKTTAILRKIEHPYTEALAHFMAAWFFESLDEYRRSLEHSEKSIQISNRYGLRMQESWAHSFRGWALANLGKLHKGLQQMELGVQSLGSIGWALGTTELLGLQAVALSRLPDNQPGAAILEKAFKRLQETGESYYEAELHRAKSQFLLKNPSSDRAAESCLRRGITAARRQGAKWFELRSATALARHYLETGRVNLGYRTLYPVYSWFTEGFDTADLQSATKLLKKLKKS